MSDFIQVEILFNSVELELTKRWSTGEVPTLFARRPVEHLQKVVKGWWQIYHESTAAAQERNRTVWTKSVLYPADALDTDALINALNQIHKLIDADALSAFRPIREAEISAIILLVMLINHYAKPKNLTSA